MRPHMPAPVPPHADFPSLFLAGGFLAAGLTFLLGGGFFLEAWRHRRSDREYLMFGLATMSLGGYSASVGGIFIAVGLGAWESFPAFADLAFGFSASSSALLLDFAMCYVGSSRRAVASASYAFAAVAGCVAWLGYWRVSGLPTMSSVEVLGLSLPAMHVELTWLGKGLGAGLLAMVVVTCRYLIVDLFRSGSQRSGFVVFGAGLLLLTFAHDIAALGFGLFKSVSLIALGFLVFVYGVAITLVSRYGQLSQQLELHEIELGARSDELSLSLEELQRTQEELVHSEQLAVVGEFAAVITHEVRNPMTIVNNAVTSLRRVDLVTDNTRTLLGIIEQEMLRLERLVSHLLSYARPLVPQRQAVELSALLDGCLTGAERAHPDVEIAVACEGPWPTVYVDPDMMTQVVHNVATNAIQAMDARGELSVHVARRRVDGVRSIIIGFEDTGEGMTEHQLEQAMSPFYTTRPGGTGLGLAICERIIDVHGGMLVVSSDRGVGTAVSVILPEKPDERLRATKRPASIPPSIHP